jgi:hypothetical protein
MAPKAANVESIEDGPIDPKDLSNDELIPDAGTYFEQKSMTSKRNDAHAPFSSFT